jgi:hypothetical protein
MVGCGIVLEVSDNKVIKIKGNKEHPTLGDCVQRETPMRKPSPNLDEWNTHIVV